MKAVMTPDRPASSASTKSAASLRLEGAKLRSNPRPFASVSALTLVEAAISAALLGVGLLSILGGLTYSYTTAAGVRYRDSAHFVLKSLSDQFLVMPAETSTGGFQPMWANTGGVATGLGLAWQDINGTTTTPASTTSTGMSVTLASSSGNPITANVTRKVGFLNPAGVIDSTLIAASGGNLLGAEFTITYTFKGQPQSQKIHVVRAWP